LARKGARSGRATCSRAGLELGDLIRLGLAGQLAHEVAAIDGLPAGIKNGCTTKAARVTKESAAGNRSLLFLGVLCLASFAPWW
jgi:hypothetical protein